jgi:hypothetical protein
MDKEKKQLVVFGYGLAVILGLVSAHLWRQHGWYSAHLILLPSMIALVLVTSLNYRMLQPLYRQWMKVAHGIGAIITGILLSVLFYLVFGIAGIILRLLRKDLLNERIDRAADSYWITKNQTHFDKSHYTRQF